MDFGDGTKDGVYTFNKDWSEKAICKTIQEARKSRQSVKDCFAPANGGPAPPAYKGTWESGKWSDCSQKCGNQGVKKRSVECHDGRGRKIDEKECDQAKKPASEEPCNRFRCTNPNGCACDDWKSYGACEPNSGLKNRTRNCNDKKLCSQVGESSAEFNVCNDGRVAIGQQVYLQISRKFSTIGKQEVFKQEVQRKLPKLLGMDDNQIKMTSLGDAGSDTVKFTFYTISNSLSFTTLDVAALEKGQTVVRPDVVVAAVLQHPDMPPLNAKVLVARQATDADLGGDKGPSSGGSGSDNAAAKNTGSSKKSKLVFILIGVAGGLFLIAIISVLITRHRRKQNILLK